MPFASILILSVPDVTKPKMSALGEKMPVLESFVKENVGAEMEPKPPLNDVPEIMFDAVIDVTPVKSPVILAVPLNN
jgi:hypothetical protein